MSRTIDLSGINFTDIYGYEDARAIQSKRYEEAIASFDEAFGDDGSIEIYSAPGRTEIGGNHTDHQKGEVLAASINKDAIAFVRRDDTGKVRVISGKAKVITMSVTDLEKIDSEEGTTAALIRGVIFYLKDKGFSVGGFDAYITSDVLIGAGLSSSAAFETLIGTIISGLYNNMEIDPVVIAMAGQFAENKFFGKPCGLMDQMACSVGNLVHIDFKDTDNPEVERVDFDFSKTPYCLCITDTKGSHSDLTDEYAAIPSEMKEIAKLLGHEVLRPVTLDDILDNIAMLREKAGDRAVLRAIHFVAETRRAGDEAAALKTNNLEAFLKLVRQSGNSSFKYLQNAYTSSDITHQNMSVALAVSDAILGDDEVSRVHGGGFAGTIQAWVKTENSGNYQKTMDKIFGEGSCEILKIRKYGGMKIL